MSLCRQCGVEVDDDVHCCPLCRNPLQPGAEAGRLEQPPPAPGPKSMNRPMRRWVLEAFTLLAVTGAIVVFAADFAFGMSLTWARYPLAAIAFLWLAAAVLIVGSGRVWVSLPSEVVAAGLFLFVLDGLTPGSPWFFPLALPLTLLAGTILGLTLAIVRILKLSLFSTIAAVMLGAALSVVGLELILNRYLADRWSVSWSAAAFVCTLPLVLLLLYLRKRFKTMQTELRKRLHL